MIKLTPIILAIRFFFKFRLRPWKRNYSKLLDRKSFSQAGQDLFVLTALDWKSHGTYVELGSQEPFKNNNTYLLEFDHSWSGVSLDIRQDNTYFFNRSRRNPCLDLDATTVDYRTLFQKYNLPRTIDYLQIDIDPAEAALAALKRIPLNDYSFATITFEHDAYHFGEAVRRESRDLLLAHGYALFAGDVKNLELPFEDWWIKPDLVASKFFESAPNFHGLDYSQILSYFIRK
jgi:hypothetical protein